MTRRTMLGAIPLVVSLGLTPVSAQFQNNSTPKMNCESSSKWNNDGKRVQACEIKEQTIAATGKLTIDGGTNGGVSVLGWSQNNVLVRAKVQTWAPTESEAKGLISQIRLQASGGQIRNDAPDFGRDRGYAVSYEIFVPHNTSISTKAHNGGIQLSDLKGDLEFETTNGGAQLTRLAGNVKGRTTNGGLQIDLMGDRWDGNQMDVSTTNGGVMMKVPANYSARVETSTVNGGISVDFPIQVSGKISKDLNVTLGNGGALLRATTTNGGVKLQRKS
jgi:hypothetical protein